MNQYKTIENNSKTQFIEKRSKFICYACPVAEESEANEYIKKVRSEHMSAKHNVYAYRIKEQQIDRYSDDGEPQGTAGIQVLNVLKGLDVENLSVVITRYFGGILLGTGGLVRAYSHGARLAVESSNIILMKKCKVVKVSLDYEMYNRVQSTIKGFKVQIEDIKFLETISIIFAVEIGQYYELEKRLKEMSSGEIFMEILEEKHLYFK